MKSALKLTLHKVTFASLVCMLFATAPLQAQLEVFGNLTEQATIDSLSGEGVVISNLYFDCPDGAYGYFNCDNCSLGMDGGVLLTTGSIDNTLGPNNQSGASEGLNAPGDPDLDVLADQTTHDACALYMDIEVSSDSLSFNYIFGSEEYLEYVNSINDVFAFYISGPGITGQQNIALIPGTNTPIAINNVNSIENSEYYIENGEGSDAPYVNDDYYIQYDGFTTILTAEAAVIPCETYTLKLVVADASDSVLDSGVFIQAGSISTNAISVSSTTALADAGFDNAVEGCVNGILDITLDYPDIVDKEIFFSVSGTAEEGVDYTGIPTSIIIPAGETEAQVIIQPIDDGIEEGTETIIIAITNSLLCSGQIVDSTFVNIQDNIVASAHSEVNQTCAGTAVQLLGTGGANFQWIPSDYLSNPNIANPVAVPQESITYACVATVGPCTDTAYVSITVGSPDAIQVSTPVETCPQVPAQLSASGGAFYVWQPQIHLSCYDCPNPVFQGDTSVTYTLQAVEDIVGCSSTSIVEVIVDGNSNLIADSSMYVCPGQIIPYDLTMADSYTISPTNDVIDDGAGNIQFTTNQNTQYTINVTSGQCEQTATLTFQVSDFIADAGADVFECESISTMLGTPMQNFIHYQWSPSDYLDNDTLAQPTITISDSLGNYSQIYTLTATDSLGCTQTDQVEVRVDAQLAITIEATDDVDYGMPVQLSVTGAGSDYQYLWTGEAITDPTTANPLIFPDNSGEYSVQVTSPNGCIGADTIFIEVGKPPVLLVPTSFSPNNDGINDYLRPVSRGIGAITKFKIYNRWGNSVYDSTKSNDSTLTWDGTLSTGENAPVGAYVFAITYFENKDDSTSERIQEGTIMLIR